MLSCLGGVIGLLLAQIAIAIAAPLMRVPWTFGWEINLIAFAVSVLIGIVFGYFPARRAASLNPIDALRYE
jgi:putative ABC transport system permease protein